MENELLLIRLPMSENEADQKAEVPAGCFSGTGRQRQGWRLSCSAFASLLRSTSLCHTQVVSQPVATLSLSHHKGKGPFRTPELHKTHLRMPFSFSLLPLFILHRTGSFSSWFMPQNPYLFSSCIPLLLLL